ncbi:MAG: hypothetical protein ABW215_07560 [Kibdelosporangium sp.]
MVYWKRDGAAVVGDFPPDRFRLLYWFVDSFRTMLADADVWHLVQHFKVADIAPGSTVGAAHERAMAIVGQRERALAADSDRAGDEWDHLGQMVTDADIVLETLADVHTGPVLTAPVQCTAWVWTLYECAMDVAFQHGIQWGWQGTAGPATDQGSDQQLGEVVAWMLEVVDALIDVLDIFP